MLGTWTGVEATAASATTAILHMCLQLVSCLCHCLSSFLGLKPLILVLWRQRKVDFLEFYVYHVCIGALGNQKKMKAVVSHLTRVQGSKYGPLDE